jgi:PAS domain S-box-containing protein
MSDQREPSGRTILIVDDNPVNLGVVVEHLEYRGFEVAVALGGEEAVGRASYLRPDLILLDVMMPGIDGFETCRRLKAQPETQFIPVIFMTALGDVSDKTEGFAAGGVDYVSKPFQVGDLLARVGAHIELGAAQAKLRQEIEAARAELGNDRPGRPGSRFRQLFETSDQGILLVDRASGMISDANPAAAAMLGAEAADLIGRELAGLPGLGAPAAEGIGRITDAGPARLGACRIERPGGAISVELAATARRDGQGELVELTLSEVGESNRA